MGGWMGEGGSWELGVRMGKGRVDGLWIGMGWGDGVMDVQRRGFVKRFRITVSTGLYNRSACVCRLYNSVRR